MKKRINLKVAIAILIILLAIIVVFALIYKANSAGYKAVSSDGDIYYQRLSTNTWNGEYHQENFYTENAIDNTMEVVSYSKYLELVNSINSIISNNISNYYSDENCNYIILSYATGYSWCEMELVDCILEENKIIIYGDEYQRGVMGDGSGYFIAIPTNMPIGTKIEYRECYTDSQIRNLEKYGTSYNPTTVDKPIIYLYPTEDIELSIKLGNEDKITCSYPQYTTGWNILAKTSSDLIDLNTNKTLYALYYESEAVYDFDVQDDGFIIKGTDSAQFLEEKLKILGLTEREAEEFIIYWLPKLQDNEYNYIRFATSEEINQNMPLEFSIQPDTLIRVLMTYKGLNKTINVEEQHLETPERTGFVAVEWGGTEIK